MDSGNTGLKSAPQQVLADDDYRAQADFRYALRRFQRVSERNARAAGITPQQHLLLLTIRGYPTYPRVTITDIAEHLQLRHNGASLLVERAVQRDLLLREADPEDRRRVLVSLTAHGTQLLVQIMLANRAELGTVESTLRRLSAVIGRIGE